MKPTDGRSWCVHYTGLIGNETCAAGVPYGTIRGELVPGKGYRYPCTRPDVHTCAKREFKTQEDLEREEAEAQRSIANVARALAAIGASGARKGEIACPNCEGGRLRFNAEVARAVRVACSTPGCTAFMS